MTLGDTGGRLRATTALARWLARATRAQDVRIARYERLPGGAIQDNLPLDVDDRGGPWQGEHAFVLRTDAPSGVAASLTRAQEFAVLRVAHARGRHRAEAVVPVPRHHGARARVLHHAAHCRASRGSPAHARARAGSRRRSARRELGANLARIHAIRPPWSDAISAPRMRSRTLRRRPVTANSTRSPRPHASGARDDRRVSQLARQARRRLSGARMGLALVRAARARARWTLR